MLSFGAFTLVRAERLLLKDNAPVAIRGRAMDVLIALTDRAGQVVGVRELADLVWPDVFVEEANLRVHISTLRKVLGETKNGPRYIVNVAGRGYTFVAPVRRSTEKDDFTNAAAVNPAGPQKFPAPVQHLVGRNETVGMLSSLLLSQRFVSVVGPGGIGKTTVAVALANELRQHFGDGAICFVDLGSLADPAGVPVAVASALGCSVEGLDAEQYIPAYLADKRILIVFDCCEHLIEAVAPLCERLFHAAPSLHLLTTSREALRVDGESVHLLAPLNCPLDDASSAAQALASPAVQLFMERAASSGHHGGLSDADALVVTAICKRLDGVALAIELVASRVGTYGIQGTAGLLDSGAGLFLQGRRGALPRHQTLQGTLDWSFNLLSLTEQRVLYRLSAFVGPFELAAAYAIAGDADDEMPAVTNAISSLVDKSLIWISSAGGPAFYRLLDMTCAYAAAKLVESGEAKAVARRHASYFTGFLKAETAEELAFDGRDVTPYAPHMGNVRKALAWSFSSPGAEPIGIDLAIQSAPIFRGLSLYAECQRWCHLALGALEKADRGTRRELALQASLAISSMYARRDSEEVIAAIDRGLELAKALRDERHQLYLLADRNIFVGRRGDLTGALTAAKQSVAIAERWGGGTEKAMAEWMLGASQGMAGDQAAAVRHCRLGFKFAAEADPGRLNLFFEARGWASLARSLWLHGLPDQARDVARQTLDKAAEYKHPVSQCIALVYTIPVLIWSGDPEAAAEPIEFAIAQAAKYSLPPYHAIACSLKGEMLASNGDAAAGVSVLQEALAVLTAAHLRLSTPATTRALAQGLARLGRLDDAAATIADAVSAVEQSDETLWLPDLLRAQGEILLLQPQPDFAAAEASLVRSMDGAARQSALSWELKAAIPLARLWSTQGRIDDARTLLAGVYERFTEGFETRDLVAARRLLDQFGAAP